MGYVNFVNNNRSDKISPCIVVFVGSKLFLLAVGYNGKMAKY